MPMSDWWRPGGLVGRHVDLVGPGTPHCWGSETKCAVAPPFVVFPVFNHNSGLTQLPPAN